MILMPILLFEIITLYLLYTGPKCMPKTTVKILHNFEVFKREFPICDLGRGLIGVSHILRKRNPPCLRMLLYKGSD